MRKAMMDVIHQHKDGKKIQLKPWNDTIPTHYGGKLDQYKPELHLNFVSRTLKLHTNRKMKLKESPKAKYLFDQLYYDGNFAFQFHNIQRTQLLTIFHLSIYENINAINPLMSMKITFFMNDKIKEDNFLQDEEEAALCNIGYKADIDQEYNYFYEALRGDDKEEFSHRLMHHIFRQYGAYLFPFDITNYLFYTLRLHYGDTQNYINYCDVNICYLDILTSNMGMIDPRDGIVHTKLMLRTLQQIGESLEIKEDFSTAAQVYHFAATNMVFYLYLNDKEKLTWCFWKCAGLAYKLDEQYVEAEKAYYNAIHYKLLEIQHQFVNFVDDEELYEIFHNMLALYHCILWLPREELRPANDFEKMECVVTQLLQISGYIPQNDRFFQDNENRIPLFKPKFLQKKVAKRTLLEAFLKPTFEEFRTYLLQCYDPKKGFWLRPNLDDDRLITAEFLQEGKETYLNKVRSVYTKESFDGSINHRCNRPTCGIFDSLDEKFLCCPCKVAFYCSKDCQRQDWKQHKRTCVWQKRKNRKVKKEIEN